MLTCFRVSIAQPVCADRRRLDRLTIKSYSDNALDRFLMRVALGIVDRAYWDRRGSNPKLRADAVDYLQTDFARLTRDVLRNQALGSRLNGHGKKFLHRKSKAATDDRAGNGHK